jgi:glycerol-3-phosphate O-acyltransferase / dihydroxyacetone phosphate acyltransferase
VVLWSVRAERAGWIGAGAPVESRVRVYASPKRHLPKIESLRAARRDGKIVGVDEGSTRPGDDTMASAVMSAHRVRRGVTALLRVALRIFYRAVDVSGVDHLPRDRPYLLVLNHPNGLVDPGLVLVMSDKPISFLAKSTIFDMPVLGWLARTLRAIPVHRRQDTAADPSQNAQTFEVARGVLGDGGVIALFPEGISHDERRVLPLKPGAARIALGALTPAPRHDGDAGSVSPRGLAIVPAALFYSDKTVFRSEVALVFGPPIDVPAPITDENGAPARAQVKALTDTMEAALGQLVGGGRASAASEFADAVEAVFSDPDAPEIRFDLHKRAQLGFEYWLVHAPDVAWEARRQVEQLLASSSALGVTPTHLRYGVPTLRAASIRVTKLFAYAPFAACGWCVHVVPYRSVAWMGRRLKLRDDGEDLVSTVKVLAALLFFPLTWVALAALHAAFFGPWAGLFALASAPLLGYAALRFLELVADTAGHTAVLWTALFRRRRLERLRSMQERLGETLLAWESEIGSLTQNPSPTASTKA